MSRRRDRRDTSASQGTPGSPGAARSPEVGRALAQDVQKAAAGYGLSLRLPASRAARESISGPALCCSGPAALGTDVQTDALHSESLLRTQHHSGGARPGCHAAAPPSHYSPECLEPGSPISSSRWSQRSNSQGPAFLRRSPGADGPWFPPPAREEARCGPRTQVSAGTGISSRFCARFPGPLRYGPPGQKPHT